MKVNKNTLKKIRNLIAKAMDSEQTPSFEESWACLYEAIDALEELIDKD